MFTLNFLGTLLLKMILCLCLVVVAFAIICAIIIGAAFVQECLRGRRWF